MVKTRAIKNIDNNKWKIVLIKTIDNRVPIYYRIVNLATYEIENVPAHRILDEIINKKIEIVNIKVENSQIITLNDDGYESTEDIIIVDEFDNEVINLFEWSLRANAFLGENKGAQVISSFDGVKNGFSPSDFKIDSATKIFWTCKKGHTIKCGFPTFFGMKCECPICKMEDNDETPSLNYWANLTDNREILKWYDEAEENLAYSTDIGWRERRKVYFRKGEETKKAFLSDITAKGKKIGFSDEVDEQSINLSK